MRAGVSCLRIGTSSGFLLKQNLWVPHTTKDACLAMRLAACNESHAGWRMWWHTACCQLPEMTSCQHTWPRRHTITALWYADRLREGKYFLPKVPRFTSKHCCFASSLLEGVPFPDRIKQTLCFIYTFTNNVLSRAPQPFWRYCHQIPQFLIHPVKRHDRQTDFRTGYTEWAMCYWIEQRDSLKSARYMPDFNEIWIKSPLESSKCTDPTLWRSVFFRIQYVHRPLDGLPQQVPILYDVTVPQNMDTLIDGDRRVVVQPGTDVHVTAVFHVDIRRGPTKL